MDYEFYIFVGLLGITAIAGIFYFIQYQIKQFKKLRREYNHLVKKLEEKVDRNYISYRLGDLCFVGVGGGGCNIIEDIASLDPSHKFIHINSDLQALKQKSSKHKILLRHNDKSSLGCGGKKECGELLVDDEVKKQLFNLVKDKESIYIITSLGGGVGSGATPDIVEYLKTLDKEIVVFVTMPFSFEGKVRNSVAKSALQTIQTLSINITVLENNDLLCENESKNIGMRETFKKTSKIIYQKIIHEEIK